MYVTFPSEKGDNVRYIYIQERKERTLYLVLRERTCTLHLRLKER
jgi:hypothetical protein